ncbi:MAG TPA: class I SAM-dependent methyltransferase [Candidatus Limnocylindrales bacterium]|nr:class I SAM-dependent methyltransferase [Candidatus Limnocylindrales bacterium]
MDEATAQRLNDLNQRFYQTVSVSFDQSRQSAWPGWSRLLEHLPARRPLRVLDAGCGNGRLALFLARAGMMLDYAGVDSSAALLGAAERALTALPNVTAAVIEADFIMDHEALPDEPYDLVALFGVLHHVPGIARRQALIAALAARTAPGGLLAFTAWRFLDTPRFQQRLLAPPADLALEADDYLLDWRAGEAPTLRYCHYCDDAELETLAKASGLTRIGGYRADGQTGGLNAYCLLRR